MNSITPSLLMLPALSISSMSVLETQLVRGNPLQQIIEQMKVCLCFISIEVDCGHKNSNSTSLMLSGKGSS